MTTCGYKPSQGIYKGTPCVLAALHEGAHIFDPAKVPEPAPASAHFTEEEIADAISEEEIRKRSEKLDDAQGVWERAHARAQPKMPCPECTGNGQVVGGSLGDHCPTCHGTRVVTDDSVDFVFDMPDFAQLRGGLSAYGDALMWRRNGLPPAKVNDPAWQKKLALPAASTVPTLTTIEDLLAKGRQKHKELAAGGAPQPALPAPAPLSKSAFHQDETGIEGTASDAEIDALEAEFTDKPSGGR